MRQVTMLNAIRRGHGPVALIAPCSPYNHLLPTMGCFTFIFRIKGAGLFISQF